MFQEGLPFGQPLLGRYSDGREGLLRFIIRERVSVWQACLLCGNSIWQRIKNTT